MEDALLGLGAGGGISALSILYTIWQTKKNSDEITELKAGREIYRKDIEEKIDAAEILMNVMNDNLNKFKIEVAKEYVPIGRFVALENKIDKIYEHILKIERA